MFKETRWQLAFGNGLSMEQPMLWTFYKHQVEFEGGRRNRVIVIGTFDSCKYLVDWSRDYGIFSSSITSVVGYLGTATGNVDNCSTCWDALLGQCIIRSPCIDMLVANYWPCCHRLFEQIRKCLHRKTILVHSPEFDLCPLCGLQWPQSCLRSVTCAWEGCLFQWWYHHERYYVIVGLAGDYPQVTVVAKVWVYQHFRGVLPQSSERR
jgi:hypothetical protein